MSEQRTADNTPHVYKYGAPDTCKHCGNHRSHEVHTMTDQQTAATDNALVEKLGRHHAVPYKVAFGTLVNPDGPEAAERIKSLQAEADELRVQLAQTIMRQDDEWQQAKADRQRMRDALEALLLRQGWNEAFTSNGDPLPDASIVTLLCSMGDVRQARQALNPASKEANDEAEL